MDPTKKATEADSLYSSLEQMEVKDLLLNMNNEDQKVPEVVNGCIPQIEQVIGEAFLRMENGGRLFYIGSGTSGRLGIVDASECPPTFGVSHGLVIGIIAGGDGAIRKAVEFAEDDLSQGWKDLQDYDISENDFLIGITASGTTPYVVGAVKDARKAGIGTAGITCNLSTPLADAAEWIIEAVVGPEFVTGSTRMKAGTAQKLILNMISTSLMIKLGRVRGNKMVDMQLSNDKLVDRGTRMVMRDTGLDYEAANKLLLEKGSVRKAVDSHQAGNS